MPPSQLTLPSFTLVLSDSVTLRDFQRTQNREIQIPFFAPSSDEGLMRPLTQAFIIYKCTYYPEDSNTRGNAKVEKPVSNGLFWRRLKMVLLTAKRFGGKFVTA